MMISASFSRTWDCLVDVVHLGGQGRRPQDDVADGRLAARIGMAVEEGEEQGADPAVLVFAGQEDPLPGDEAVVEDHVGVRRPWDEAPLVVLPRPQVVDGDDLLQPVPVARNGEGHGVILVLGAQGPGRDHQDLVGHGGLGDVHLAAVDDDPVLEPLLDPHIGARVRLVGRAEHPVALHVGLGAAADEVLRLEAGEPFLEVLVVLGGPVVQLVRLVGDVVDGVRRVDPHAALDAAADLLAEHARHVLFLVQVVRVLMDMGEAVDPLPREVGDGRAELLILRLGRLVVGRADGVDAIHLEFVRPVDQLAVDGKDSVSSWTAP